MEILIFTDVKEAIHFLPEDRSRVVQVTVLADIEKPQSLGGLKEELRHISRNRAVHVGSIAVFSSRGAYLERTGQ